MRMQRFLVVVLLVGVAVSAQPSVGRAQCCLSNMFAGCSSCFRKAPPAYATAPIMAAPIMAVPIAAPVVVPVQQVSYVPETTYRTQYECVPVTSYKPSYEIDPCTGCTRECSEQVTNYVQRAVNVPYTQYRAVYSTKYVQMPPGSNPAAVTGTGAPVVNPGPVGTVASPFAAPIQTAPQAWGAAGTDVPPQFIPGQQNSAAPVVGTPQAPMPQPTFQQQIVPQSGTYATPVPVQPQLTAPPALAPAPSLKPIPELPRTVPNGSTNPAASSAESAPFSGIYPGQSQPNQAVPATGNSATGMTNGNAMPILPGTGPAPSTGAFPKLLEPTSHTTSWQPFNERPAAPLQPISATVMIQSNWQPAGPIGQPHVHAAAYPTAALPTRMQQ